MDDQCRSCVPPAAPSRGSPAADPPWQHAARQNSAGSATDSDWSARLPGGPSRLSSGHGQQVLQGAGMLVQIEPSSEFVSRCLLYEWLEHLQVLLHPVAISQWQATLRPE